MAQQRQAPAEDRSLKDLFSDLTAELSFLVSREVELAKTEMKEKASLAAKGGVAMALGGVAALLAVLLLSFAAAWGLAEVIAPGLAFLAVGVVHLIVAAVMLAGGRKRLARMKPPAPEQTMATLKQDLQVAKSSFQRGMSGAARPSAPTSLGRR